MEGGADVSLRDEELLDGDWLEQSAHSAVQTAGLNAEQHCMSWCRKTMIDGRCIECWQACQLTKPILFMSAFSTEMSAAVDIDPDTV